MRPSRCLLAELRSRPKASPKATSKTSPKTTAKSSSKSSPKTTSKPPPQPLPNYTYNHPWLCTLKLAQLTAIARATGIRSGGTKGILCQRIDRELPKRGGGGGGHADAAAGRAEHDGSDSGKDGGLLSGSGIDFGKGLSVLSIDMGIKNLAFAHLVVPGRKTREEQQEQQQGEGEDTDPLPILNAWRRIDVSRLPNDALSASEAARMMKMVNQNPSTVSESTSSSTLIDTIAQEEETSTTPSTTPTQSTSITEDEEFLPLTLAPRAYTLVSALLAAYNPTHVLIERQRFRNQSAAAVFESTLRVGVFEGMLYSTFLALARERAGDGEGSAAPRVVPIEPPRVVRYLLAERVKKGKDGFGVPVLEGEEKEKEKAKSKRLSNRESKNLKIDLVGGWLASTRPLCHFDLDAEPELEADAEPELQEASTSLDPNSSTTIDNNPQLKPKLTIAPNNDLLHRWISAYLTKWPGLDKMKKKEKKKKRDDVITREVRKLDDLADSLAQGVTWLEWMRTRERVASGGARVVDGIIDGDVDGEGAAESGSAKTTKRASSARSTKSTKTTKTTKTAKSKKTTTVDA